MSHFESNRKGPSWRIVCDKKEAESFHYRLSLVLLDDPSPFSKPPIIDNEPSFSYTAIYCDIDNSTDETDVRKSAEFIRKRIDYPFGMLCFKIVESTGTWTTCFLHTPDGELYKEDETEFELLYPSEITEIKVLESSKVSLRPEKLPSQITDQDYLYLPPTKEGIAKMKDKRAGKWMICTSRRDMARHDDRFLAMVTLFQKEIFVGLKAATAMTNEAIENQMLYTTGTRNYVLIHCYTADSENKEDVLRVAQAIRDAIQYKCLMYYKTNYASIVGNYEHEGKRHVSRYMYSVGGGFYERDHWNRFKFLI